MLPHFPPIFSRAHQLSLSPALFEEEDEDDDSAERKLHVKPLSLNLTERAFLPEHTLRF